MGIDELVAFPGPVSTTFCLDPKRMMVVAVSQCPLHLVAAVLPSPGVCVGGGGVVIVICRGVWLNNGIAYWAGMPNHPFLEKGQPVCVCACTDIQYTCR